MASQYRTELAARAISAQNHPANVMIDITTFVHIADTDAQAAAHVAYYEARVAAYVAPARRRKAKAGEL